MDNQFSQRVSDIIVYSKEEANRLRNNYIGPEHILLGLIRDGEGKAIEILSTLHVNLAEVKRQIEIRLKPVLDESLQADEDISLTDVTTRILKMCILEARGMKSNVTDTEHVLLAILREKNNLGASVLNENGVTYTRVQQLLSPKSDRNNDEMKSAEEDVLNLAEDDEYEMSFFTLGEDQTGRTESNQQTKTTSKKSSHDTPILNKYGMDLTNAAEEGLLDPIVGREKEIERLAQILSRRKKNNPILIGEPGVGKSAIVEGLALRIIQKKVSRMLFDKRVVVLDLSAVLAGAKYRGQFEERILGILNEIRKNPDVILFIDEIHTLVGAGSAAGSMDAANILKPALARGEIQCIGATTLDEYRKSIESDGALERRFQKVMVEPTTPEETLRILSNIKEKYEDHHNVCYTDEALEACVSLTNRYITDRNFPDKAIDALDEAGARVNSIHLDVPKAIVVQEKKIEDAKNKKNEAVKSQNFELAASFRDKEKELSAALEVMKDEWEATLKEKRQSVTEEDIAEVVSMISGIPVQRMAQAEGIKLAGMKDNLQSKVIAQDAAVDKLVKAILRSRVGLKDPNKPIGVFMFLGPTGVGKTHLAKELSKYMFGSSDALIRIDMSEYMEKFTVSRLVGAPPGYVGYEDGGQLTEKVRRKPYSIVLLDEIEKAHADVYNLLLQVMDEGRLTDSVGRVIDFKNTVIIMTSNIGTRQLKEFGRGVGFIAQRGLDEKEHSRSVIQKALDKSFAPEFLNRIDEIITFEQLPVEAIVKIIDIELKALCERLETVGYKLLVEDEAKKYIAKKGYDVQYGARPLKRAIQTYLEDGLSELIISSTLKKGDAIKVSFNEEKDELEMIIIGQA